MVLDNKTINKIEEFVYNQPRSMQEIAEHLSVSWRTADRYIQEIEKEFGTIAIKTFRQGTRGALKIVYWASVEKLSKNVFQEKLEQQISIAKRKEDFSAFDIYQHIDNKNKKVIVEKKVDENSTNLKELAELLNSTKKQLLIFSGNLSFTNLKNKSIDIMKILEDLVKRNVSIKILCRVDIAGKENIEKVLALNFKYGKQAIDIRHTEHPIRAFIVDNKFFRIKEIKEPTGKIHELDKKIYIFYTVKDKEWTEWLSRVFWKFFTQSIDANKRIQEMKRLK